MKELFVAQIRLSIIFLVLNSSACSQRPKEIKTTLYAFGTLINITLYDITQQQANIAFKQLESDFQHYDHDWSPWIDGPLSKANQHFKQGESYTLPAYMIPLIRQGIVFSKQSKGMFNPTIGNLINLWQFHIHDKPNSSTTVIGNNASKADAAATALMVAGPKRWLDIAHSMKLKYVMAIDEHGTIYMNPKMATRITLENPGSTHIILSHVLTANTPLSFTANPSSWY